MSLKEKFKNFFNTDDEYEYIEEVQKEEPDNSHLKQKSNQNVVSLSAIQQPSSKVILCEPKSYNEVQEIADNLLNKRAVVINLQRVDHTQAKRIVDFLSGTVYAIKGDIQKLGLATFLCTPDNVDVSGTITQTIIDEAELEKGW
ncbi:cell division protein SepF [Pseudogracilibacillus auburnensis]|uniref:Cell division protein SepF n=1 Tax=Pseudogracilibacillus auburnensis TaxID=1494959 RepID=A0A2V3W677_9BACI|nr:cell division protein SepF [Pseudogracilibacillus auburnensis]PXW88531.1 cell division inhibitor SepF [Pseudogracilibacillus auburnensis]